MESTPPDPQAAFFHVRVFIGFITGLGVTRLLTGLANFVQHPSSQRVYPIHFGWVIYVLLLLVHFWWFQFGLSRVPVWTFEHYFFVIVYAALLFFTCTFLFPDHIDDYSGFGDYLFSRKRWFFGLMATLVVADVIDTALKGADYFAALGAEYLARQATLFAVFVAAMFIENRRFHAVIVVLAIVSEVAWVLWRYTSLF